MDKSIYEQFRNLVYEKAGINLGDKKEALVAARVSKRLRELQLNDYKDYLDFLKKDSSETELVHLLDVISTNVTSFFRESVHFDFLTEKMSEWLGKGQRRFRFWSAACSSGEEPYTMAMVLSDIAAGCDVDVRILATDISTRILAKAQSGEYPLEKVNAVPSSLLNKYFSKMDCEGKNSYTVCPAIKEKILFKRLNLSVPPFPMKGPMDAVFCRNVMIYFDNTVRRKLLSEISRLLKPGGVLFVGHAESLAGQLCTLKNVKPSIYVKE
ncbi:Chemotaxis protein methyltransferase CheR [Chitinispirillum alkaliphilum]|nr:Chemotaxis protein methyltransferase CheR [Chitinispirillum alkaliphilum]